MSEPAAPAPIRPLPSATVMLVRDAPGLEVLMVRRHHEIEFASGALVFPGGKVEEADSDERWSAISFGWDAVPAGERALRICAIRECFEESGILIARHPDASWDVQGRGAGERDSLAEGRRTFRDIVEGLGLRLDIGAMTRFAHWVTPAGLRKRFDTHFYLLTAPADQIAACDGCETVDAEWIAPREALRLGEAGERTVLFPTRLNLKLLAEAASVGDALDRAAARRVVTVEPVLDRLDGRTVATIPPDAGYGVVERQSL